MRAETGPVPGALLVVATPIGNLGDVTVRALETLRAAHRVVAEDTRRTRALLAHFGIAGKPVERLDAHAGPEQIDRVLRRLAEGERVALVTDAGTPVVSDPGTALVKAAADAGFSVVPIPGPSAVTAALSVSGLVAGAFWFLGFLPRAGQARREAIERIRTARDAVVLFEAPTRFAATLADLAAAMPGRPAVVARELTKVHEEVLRGSLTELASSAPQRTWLGEITVVLGPWEPPERAAEEAAFGHPGSAAEIERRIDAALAAGRGAKDIARDLSAETGLSRRELYKRVLARRGAC